MQGVIYVEAGITLDRESNVIPHDQNGSATFTFGVSATDGGSPSQQSYASVSLTHSSDTIHKITWREGGMH